MIARGAFYCVLQQAGIRHRADVVWIRDTFGVGPGPVQCGNGCRADNKRLYWCRSSRSVCERQGLWAVLHPISSGGRTRRFGGIRRGGRPARLRGGGELMARDSCGFRALDAQTKRGAPKGTPRSSSEESSEECNVTPAQNLILEPTVNVFVSSLPSSGS